MATTNTWGQMEQANQKTANSADAASNSMIPGSQSGPNILNGFASRCQSSLLDQYIWSNPWSILPDAFSGINQAGSCYQALRDFGADPQMLCKIMTNTNHGPLDSWSTGSDDFANWLEKLCKPLGIVSGQGFSGKGLLNSLFNPTANPLPTNIAHRTNSLGEFGECFIQFQSLASLLRRQEAVFTVGERLNQPGTGNEAWLNPKTTR